ncbi:hypothetical protein WKI68_39025 [Streptomyces sp. MS1.HAVA.3]|uniref:Uncharacterized protein n=1 Tax=Streptomyces caledonius TaxID=3134107 RepID=A0ABU8UCJ3_9ACTN
MALSPDGRLIAFGRADGSAGLLGAQPGVLTRLDLAEHAAAIHAMSFSPDGRLLASASADGTVRLWDSGTGLAVGPPLTDHSDSVNGVAFSPDGRSLATTSGDHTVMLYERRGPTRSSPLAERALTAVLRTRRAVQLPPVTAGGGALVRVAFSSDGQVLACTATDWSVLLLDPVSGRALSPASPTRTPSPGPSPSLLTAGWSPCPSEGRCAGATRPPATSGGRFGPITPGT